MSASDDPLSVSITSTEESRITRLFARARSAESLVTILTTSIGVIIYGGARGIARIMAGVVDFFVAVIGGAAVGTQNLLLGFFNSLIRPIFAGALGTASAVGPGSQLALVGLPVGVGMVLIAAWLVARFRQEDETTDSFFFGTGVDFGPLGTDEEADPED
ncbi:hypothetical protein [Haloglomus halophilum]|uniref:hypothetical protein n=1 Tax=Haloglomus halophilum TaxID=2962672 RepID=UPI0020C93F9E|nr:hypothetical protein [Haloglomus halophilum]